MPSATCIAKKMLLSLVALSCICKGFRVKQQSSSDTLADSHVVEKSAGLEERVKGCDTKLVRFRQLDNQAWFTAGQDPSFPNVIDSIAGSGATCGDSAQGIQKACNEYNKWTTFQKVARSAKLLGAPLTYPRRRSSRFSGAEQNTTEQNTTIHFKDIKQGTLGNCGFLAGLAAIVVHHPEIIENMFVEKELWPHNIFKTKWFLQGSSQTLTVDNTLPGNAGRAFFTQPSSENDFWPVILAKTWAKAFGSFWAAEGTGKGEVIRAITRAPSQYFSLQTHFHGEKAKDDLWEMLNEWSENEYAVTASTAEKKYNIAAGHAYAVIDVFEKKPFGKLVKIFNPHNADRLYNGAMAKVGHINGPTKGDFTVTLNEFYDAFDSVEINYVKPDYSAVSVMMSVDRLNIAVKVSVPMPGKFWVSIVWPSERMLHPCEYVNWFQVRDTLTVQSRGRRVGKKWSGRYPDDNDIVIEVENPEGGDYDVAAEVRLPSSFSWIREVALTVYGPGQPLIKGGRVPESDRDGESVEDNSSYNKSVPITCGDVPGATDRNPEKSKNKGWCKCPKGTVLGEGCLPEAILKRGQRYFEKAKLEALTPYQLRILKFYCKCE